MAVLQLCEVEDRALLTGRRIVVQGKVYWRCLGAHAPCACSAGCTCFKTCERDMAPHALIKYSVVCSDTLYGLVSPCMLGDVCGFMCETSYMVWAELDLSNATVA